MRIGSASTRKRAGDQLDERLRKRVRDGRVAEVMAGHRITTTSVVYLTSLERLAILYFTTVELLAMPLSFDPEPEMPPREHVSLLVSFSVAVLAGVAAVALLGMAQTVAALVVATSLVVALLVAVALVVARALADDGDGDSTPVDAPRPAVGVQPIPGLTGRAARIAGSPLEHPKERHAVHQPTTRRRRRIELRGPDRRARAAQAPARTP